MFAIIDEARALLDIAGEDGCISPDDVLRDLEEMKQSLREIPVVLETFFRGKGVREDE
jgi:hypothetical protein